MAESTPTAEALQGAWPAGSDEPVRWRRADVERAAAGDRAAFDRLIDARLEPTFRTALAILGDEADARDACQEAFIAAWRELPRLRETDRFDAWFGRIVVNACRDALRSRHRRRVREIDVDDATSAALPSRSRPLDERIVEIDALQRAFERLSIPERTILALHHLEHRPLSDIAGILGVPEGTVKSRLHAARRSFERAWR
jgi:RNA polymerase sigma-70 factor (ECF subfamily)